MQTEPALDLPNFVRVLRERDEVRQVLGEHAAPATIGAATRLQIQFEAVTGEHDPKKGENSSYALGHFHQSL